MPKVQMNASEGIIHAMGNIPLGEMKIGMPFLAVDFRQVATIVRVILKFTQDNTLR